jgi:hypothetical protein
MYFYPFFQFKLPNPKYFHQISYRYELNLLIKFGITCCISAGYQNDLLWPFNPDYVIGFVMSVAIARKSGCLEILA